MYMCAALTSRLAGAVFMHHQDKGYSALKRQSCQEHTGLFSSTSCKFDTRNQSNLVHWCIITANEHEALRDLTGLTQNTLFMKCFS